MPASSVPLPIEAVLQTLRDEVVHDASPETAEQHLQLAATYMEIGMRDEARVALEVAGSVLLELQAKPRRHEDTTGAGDYRDVAARLEQLKVLIGR
jgi:hypothetical protein